MVLKKFCKLFLFLIFTGISLSFHTASKADHFEYGVKHQGKRGPGNNQLIVKISDNEEFDSEGEVIVNGGHVPSLIEAGGNIFMYFQWFPSDNKKWFDHIGVSVSKSTDLKWSEVRGVRFEGIPYDLQGRNIRPMDPSPAALPNGKIRLYFTLEKVQPHDRIIGDSKIYSAISDDGFNFLFEPGVRFKINEVDLRDPAIVFFKNKWHLYVPDQRRRGTGYHAISVDGLTFTREKNVEIDTSGDWLGGATVSGDTLYFFGTVWKGYSSDGINWTAERSRGLGPDPGVIKLNNGLWLGVLFRPMR